MIEHKVAAQVGHNLNQPACNLGDAVDYVIPADTCECQARPLAAPTFDTPFVLVLFQLQLASRSPPVVHVLRTRYPDVTLSAQLFDKR